MCCGGGCEVCCGGGGEVCCGEGCEVCCGSGPKLGEPTKMWRGTLRSDRSLIFLEGEDDL